MARGLKDYGLDKELKPFKQRVLRQLTLGKISKGDCDNLIAKIDDIEAYVLRMQEGRQRRDFQI